MYSTPTLLKLVTVKLDRQYFVDPVTTSTECDRSNRTASEEGHTGGMNTPAAVSALQELVVVSKLRWVGVEYLAIGTSTGRTLVVRSHLVSECSDDDDEVLDDDDDDDDLLGTAGEQEESHYSPALLGAHLVDFSAMFVTAKRASVVAYTTYQGSYLATIVSNHAEKRVEVGSVTALDHEGSPSTRVSLVEYNSTHSVPPTSTVMGLFASPLPRPLVFVNSHTTIACSK